ncbi:MAG: hypothetical protein GKR89_24940 [Candidatus Latescibacteria bacterium]|nr:hypothetical protein [Candidatus Latescibacterota bacterium]
MPHKKGGKSEIEAPLSAFIDEFRQYLCQYAALTPKRVHILHPPWRLWLALQKITAFFGWPNSDFNLEVHGETQFALSRSTNPAASAGLDVVFGLNSFIIRELGISLWRPKGYQYNPQTPAFFTSFSKRRHSYTSPIPALFTPPTQS